MSSMNLDSRGQISFGIIKNLLIAVFISIIGFLAFAKLVPDPSFRQIAFYPRFIYVGIFSLISLYLYTKNILFSIIYTVVGVPLGYYLSIYIYFLTPIGPL